jgi:hypothetical protein
MHFVTPPNPFLSPVTSGFLPVDLHSSQARLSLMGHLSQPELRHEVEKLITHFKPADAEGQGYRKRVLSVPRSAWYYLTKHGLPVKVSRFILPDFVKLMPLVQVRTKADLIKLTENSPYVDNDQFGDAHLQAIQTIEQYFGIESVLALFSVNTPVLVDDLHDIEDHYKKFLPKQPIIPVETMLELLECVGCLSSHASNPVVFHFLRKTFNKDNKSYRRRFGDDHNPALQDNLVTLDPQTGYGYPQSYFIEKIIVLNLMASKIDQLVKYEGSCYHDPEITFRDTVVEVKSYKSGKKINKKKLKMIFKQICKYAHVERGSDRNIDYYIAFKALDGPVSTSELIDKKVLLRLIRIIRGNIQARFLHETFEFEEYGMTLQNPLERKELMSVLKRVRIRLVGYDNPKRKYGFIDSEGASLEFVTLWDLVLEHDIVKEILNPCSPSVALAYLSNWVYMGKSDADEGMISRRGAELNRKLGVDYFS